MHKEKAREENTSIPELYSDEMKEIHNKGIYDRNAMSVPLEKDYVQRSKS